VLIIVAIFVAVTVSSVFGIVAIGAVVALLDGARHNGLARSSSKRRRSGHN